MTDTQEPTNEEAEKAPTPREISNANLQKWGEDNPPPKGGRPPGSLNRTTLFQKWLEAAALKKFATELQEKLGDDAPKLESIADLLMAKKLLEALNDGGGRIDNMFDQLFGKLADNANINQNNTGDTLGAILASMTPRSPLPKLPPDPVATKIEQPCPTKPAASKPLPLPNLNASKPTQ